MAKSTLELVSIDVLCACASRRSGGPEVRADVCRRARRGVTRFLCGVCGPWGARDTAHGAPWSRDTHSFDTQCPFVLRRLRFARRPAAQHQQAERGGELAKR